MCSGLQTSMGAWLQTISACDFQALDDIQVRSPLLELSWGERHWSQASCTVCLAPWHTLSLPFPVVSFTLPCIYFLTG